jgi:hypothetical protein
MKAVFGALNPKAFLRQRLPREVAFFAPVFWRHITQAV